MARAPAGCAGATQAPPPRRGRHKRERKCHPGDREDSAGSRATLTFFSIANGRSEVRGSGTCRRRTMVVGILRGGAGGARDDLRAHKGRARTSKGAGNGSGLREPAEHRELGRANGRAREQRGLGSGAATSHPQLLPFERRARRRSTPSTRPEREGCARWTMVRGSG